MKKAKFDFDLIVIGSGAGGSAAAVLAAKNGLKVAVVEKDLFGGESPNYGEIPNRAIFQAAKTLFEVKKMSKNGIRATGVGVNFQALAAWRELTVKRTGAHDNIDFFEKSGIKTIRGNARFINPHEITVNQQHFSAKNFLVATGSRYKIPQISGLKSVKFLTPRDIFSSPRPPKSIFIIGGSDEAVEIAQTLSILGTKVYLSEVSARILPKLDEEIGIAVENSMVDEVKIAVLTNTRVVAVEADRLGKKVIFQRGGEEKFVRVDEILIADGREPNTDIGLENANINYDDSGIFVNENLQTSSKHIFATGSVISGGATTTEALIQSRTAAHNILTPRQKIIASAEFSPKVINIFPEVATVGLSEDDCIKRDLRFKTAIAPLNLIARSNTENFSHGFVKLICDKKGRILGGAVVCPEAASLIGEVALAARFGLTADDIASTPHAFQSWSEAIRICASRLR